MFKSKEAIMMNEEPIAGLSLEYKGSEQSPDKETSYAMFSVQMTDDNFAGKVDFELTHAYIGLLASQLSTLYTTLEGTTEIVAGWGDTVLLSLKLSRFDKHGNILLDCTMQNPYAAQLVGSLHTYQLIEISQIDELARYFNAVLSYKEQIAIQLSAKSLL